MDSKTYQIVLNRYKDIFQILNSFDLQSCQVAIDNNYIYFTERGWISYNYKINIINNERIGKYYVNRLRKYKFRGFNVIGTNGDLIDIEEDEEYYSDYLTEVMPRSETKIKRINLGYLLGLNDYIIYNNQFYIGNITDTIYKKDWINWSKGCGIFTHLGKTHYEVISNFNKLKYSLVKPEIKFRNDILRLNSYTRDEKILYNSYEPLWKPSIHFIAPIKYIYISKGLDQYYGLYYFKQEVMKLLSILLYIDRI